MIEKLKELSDILPFGVVFFDKDLFVLSFNKSARKIFSAIENLEKAKLEDFVFLKDRSNNNPQRFSFSNCIKNENKISSLVYFKNNNTLMPLFISFVTVNLNEIYAILTIANLSETSVCSDLLAGLTEKEIKDGFYNIIGNDKKMLELYKLIELAADSDSNVLIYGESGTGKELIAKAIHDRSSRKDHPFVAVNCSALSETLLESELFGHIKGAFTGAYRDKIGKFEAAHKGTIFLDEIGDISPLIQLKLLRVIQEKTIVRVGDNREIKVDMRIITATNKELREMVDKGLFREDLFYRLKVFSINPPPLREHKSDIPILVRHFIEMFNKKSGKRILDITEDALRSLMDYCWPGNVRELENAIEHAFVVCSGQYIEIFDLPQEIRSVTLKDMICKGKENSIVISDKIETKRVKARDIVSKERIIELLKKNNYNKSETARQLGLSRIALWKKLKKYNIE